MAMRLHSSSALSCSALLPLVLRRVSFLRHERRLSPRRFSAQTVPCGRPPLEVSALARNGLSFEEDDFASSAELCFESPLKIVEYPDPILRAQNKRINTFDDNLKKLVNEMFDIMYKTDGIGLSAPQVGVNVQLMVFNPAGEPGEGEEIVLVNPVVYKASKGLFSTMRVACPFLAFMLMWSDLHLSRLMLEI